MTRSSVCWKTWEDVNGNNTPPPTIDPLEHCTLPDKHLGLHTWEDQTEKARIAILNALRFANIGLESSHVRVALLLIYVDAVKLRG